MSEAIPCRGCGEAFTSTHGNQRFCSDRCRRERQSEDQKAWYLLPDNREKHRIGVKISNLKMRYGLTPEELREWFELEGGRCAICEKELLFTLESGKRRTFCVDHDHETSRVRGLLCLQCNTALGKLGDSIDGLMKAVAYLERNLTLEAVA